MSHTLSAVSKECGVVRLDGFKDKTLSCHCALDHKDRSWQPANAAETATVSHLWNPREASPVPGWLHRRSPRIAPMAGVSDHSPCTSG